MKKTIRTFSMCGMAVLLVFTASCKKEQENGNVSFQAAMPQMGVINADGERAYIDSDFAFHWNTNDAVKVYNLSSNPANSSFTVFETQCDEGAEWAYFNGPSLGPKQDLDYRVMYPAARAVGTVNTPEEFFNGNRETFELKDTQMYTTYNEDTTLFSIVDGTAMLMAAETKNLRKSVIFRHVCGAASFVFHCHEQADVYVKQIAITDNAYNLTGTVGINLDRVNVDRLQYLVELFKTYQDDKFAVVFQNYVMDTLGYVSAPTGKTITMNCMPNGTPKKISGASGGTKFTFMLRPLALSQGFTLTLTICDADGNNERDVFIDAWNRVSREYTVKPGEIRSYDYQTNIQ